MLADGASGGRLHAALRAAIAQVAQSSSAARLVVVAERAGRNGRPGRVATAGRKRINRVVADVPAGGRAARGGDIACCMRSPLRSAVPSPRVSSTRFLVISATTCGRVKANGNPLWDDLMALTRNVLVEGPGAKPHFLGAIITKQIGAQGGFLDRWWVVDGQQRLTTLQLLIAATRSALQEIGLAQCASIFADTLVNATAVVQRSADKYKITHKSSDYTGFSGIIDAALGDSDTPGDDALPIHDCYGYFRDSVAEWIGSVPEDARHQHATALTQAILDGLQVVDIRLDGHENSHAIFEALNARGEPLTEWEKTKNYMLSLAVGDDDPDGDRTYTDHLEQYDTGAYWTQWVSVPRFSGKRIELFLFFLCPDRATQTPSGSLRPDGDAHVAARSPLPRVPLRGRACL